MDDIVDDLVYRHHWPSNRRRRALLPVGPKEPTPVAGRVEVSWRSRLARRRPAEPTDGHAWSTWRGDPTLPSSSSPARSISHHLEPWREHGRPRNPLAEHRPFLTTTGRLSKSISPPVVAVVVLAVGVSVVHIYAWQYVCLDPRCISSVTSRRPTVRLTSSLCSHGCWCAQGPSSLDVRCFPFSRTNTNMSPPDVDDDRRRQGLDRSVDGNGVAFGR